MVAEAALGAGRELHRFRRIEAEGSYFFPLSAYKRNYTKSKFSIIKGSKKGVFGDYTDKIRHIGPRKQIP